MPLKLSSVAWIMLCDGCWMFRKEGRIMQITGFQIREALKRWNLRLETADKQFKNSLWAFEGEQMIAPLEVGKNFKEADEAVARLENLQQRYNQKVEVDVLSKKMTLGLAVKMIGGAGRREKMWRLAATDTGRDRYSYRDMTRKADDIQATRQVTVEEAMKQPMKRQGLLVLCVQLLLLAMQSKLNLTILSRICFN